MIYMPNPTYETEQMSQDNSGSGRGSRGGSRAARRASAQTSRLSRAGGFSSTGRTTLGGVASRSRNLSNRSERTSTQEVLGVRRRR